MPRGPDGNGLTDEVAAMVLNIEMRLRKRIPSEWMLGFVLLH